MPECPGEWMLDALDRYADLDGVTEEDVESGRLNDDMLQVLSGMSLEEAQDYERREIVVVCNGVPETMQPQEVVKIMFKALLKSGGKMISEPYEVDDGDGYW